MMVKLGFEFFTVQYFNECKKARARFSGKNILTSSSTTEAAAEAEAGQGLLRSEAKNNSVVSSAACNSSPPVRVLGKRKRK